MHSPITYPARRIWLWLTTALIALGSGHFYASDEEAMFGVTLRMWQAIHHMVDPQVVVTHPILTPYGPMQSVLALFTLPLGHLLAWLGPAEMQSWLVRLPSTWINAIMVASIATLLGWVSVQRGYSARIGIWLAISYAIATPALKYAGSFFSEPTASWWLLLAALPILVSTPLRTRTYIVSGLACLAAILSKVAVAPTLAVIGMLVLGSALHRRDWRTILAWGGSAAVAGGLFLVYNLVARGDVLSSGYNSRQQGYSIAWDMIATGIHGQFLSSGKSIFLYAPVLCTLPLGVWLLRTQWRWLGALAAICASVVFVHTNVVFWHGDGAWGPRYVMLCLPFMMLPLAAVYAWIAQQPARWRVTIAALLVGASAIVQISAVAINFNAYILTNRDSNARYYQPSASPIVAQWQILVSQLQLSRASWSTPGVTLAGWTYSEGDRDLGQQFPRFAGPDAHITVRPRGNAWPMLHADYHTCFDPNNQLSVTVTLDTRPLATGVTCPPRVIHVLLPRATSHVYWQSAGVHIAGLTQHAWYDTLSATVRTLRVGDTYGEYAIYARLTPPARMPNDPDVMRVWASDIRSGFYDVWWYYLTAIPVSQSAWPVVVCITFLLLTLLILAWRTPTDLPRPTPTPPMPTPPSAPPRA